MDFIEQHAQAGHTAPTPASPNQTSQARLIEQPQHLCLGESLPQFPDCDDSREVQERPRHTGARNPFEHRSILAGQAVVPMRVNTVRDSPAPHGRGHIDQRTIVIAYLPEGSGRSMRQHCVWATREHCRHPLPI
jgi:hypothetical protein